MIQSCNKGCNFNKISQVIKTKCLQNFSSQLNSQADQCTIEMAYLRYDINRIEFETGVSLECFNAIALLKYSQLLNLIIIKMKQMLKFATSKAVAFTKMFHYLLPRFSTTKSTDKPISAQRKGTKLTISQIISSQFSSMESETIPQNKQKQSVDNVLTSEILLKCTPLMRRILQGAAIKDLKTAETKLAQQEEYVQRNITNKHDLQNFSSMLAGPILNEIDLDKYCLKKQCPIILDVKYDGERTLVSFNRNYDLDMTSRNRKNQTLNYQILKQKIQKQLLQSDLKSITVDGEIIIVDQSTQQPLPFSELQKLKRFKDKENSLQDWELQLQGKSVLIYIFDVIEQNGENLMTLPLIQRRKRIPKINVFREVQYKIIHFPQERAKIFQYFKEVLQRKYQGLILKGANDLYYTTQTRGHWKKLKKGFINTRDPNMSKIELDLVLMGASKGMGFKNKDSYTSFLMGTPYNGKIIPLSNVGSGFTIDMLTELNEIVQAKKLLTTEVPNAYDLKGIRADIYFQPEIVFEIHAQELTLSPIYQLGRSDFGGLSLRFPSFKRIRDDKGIAQATKGEQIIQLSKLSNLRNLTIPV